MSENKTNAENLSNAFVEHYYYILNEAPRYLHTFYNEPCLFNRRDPATHVKKTFWTREEVKDEFLAMRYEDYTAEIETSLGIPYPMEDDRVIVFVNGYLTRKKDNVRETIFSGSRRRRPQTQIPTLNLIALFPHKPAATEN
ncbi:PREDICTED: uncharacterized protein LOC109130757 [Camelina sativa]|uniref:Uncharacterized protein LOC109130757 n=1 Tax=Camelina sativa TaxID=90675 RepID=A0ABM1RBB6_CAMSA|nr:PREDICTED: uncharacterized protein LOC109130757 [Camelina sativa]